MGLFEDCEKYFDTKDLYEVMEISHDASEAELKKAYKKISLLCHPDRVSDDRKSEATCKFQILSKVHCILTDQEKRNIYDETGCVDEENLNLDNKDWSQYWRIVFPKVTKNDIDAFMKKYKDSDEELEDLKRYYLQHEGDMDKISESFLGYNVNEEEQYRDIIMELIQMKEVPAYPKFMKETKSKRDARIKRYVREAKEDEKIAKRMEQKSLVAEITERAKVRKQRFDTMIKDLEAKYCHYPLNRAFIPYQAEAGEAEKVENDREASLINAIRERSENHYDDMIAKLEAKYVKNVRKKGK